MAEIRNRLNRNACWRNCGERGELIELWDAIHNQISQIVGYLLPNDPLVTFLGLASGNGDEEMKNYSHRLVATQLLVASHRKKKNSPNIEEWFKKYGRLWLWKN
uniref:Uncharacterized protein n=1 Tax=Chrysemys picta bellii TaxID=8478 RepID=A0A8C3INW4_CHRPI